MKTIVSGSRHAVTGTAGGTGRSASRVLIVLTTVLGAAFLGGAYGQTAPASCGLTNPAFCETFDQGPSAVRGRAGDLDPTRWSAGRMAPSDFSRGSALNPVKQTPIPACRASFSQTNVYPPDDTLICDANQSVSGQLMTAVAIQFYGNNSYMIRQPFDFAGRTGKIVFDVDAHAKVLGTYVAIDITDDPIPAPTFVEADNFEPGPVPRNGLMIKFLNLCDPDVSPSNTMVYTNYVGTVVQPTFGTSQAGCAKVREGSLNHFEISISRTHLEIYGSDYSTDNGGTFPNFRKLYAADVDLPFTRGYVHLAARNHASSKYGFGPNGIYHWDNVGFDGPVIRNTRSYEIPDSRTIGSYEGSTVMNLGYMLLDGTTGRPAGMYDSINRIDALTFQGVDLTGAVSAQLTLNAFVNWATLGMGWGVRFNGGTWRNRMMTSAEVQASATSKSIGHTALVVDVPIADLRQGVNTLEIRPISLRMDIPPAIANIDLILSSVAGTVIQAPTAPTGLKIIQQ
jgi:hypothetical protein